MSIASYKSRKYCMWKSLPFYLRGRTIVYRVEIKITFKIFAKMRNFVFASFFLPFSHDVLKILFFCNKLERQPLVNLRKFLPTFSKKAKTKIFVSILLVSYQSHMKVWIAFQTSNLRSVKIKIYVTRLQYYVLIWPLLSAMYALFKSGIRCTFTMYNAVYLVHTQAIFSNWRVIFIFFNETDPSALLGRILVSYIESS